MRIQNRSVRGSGQAASWRPAVREGSRQARRFRLYRTFVVSQARIQAEQFFSLRTPVVLLEHQSATAASHLFGFFRVGEYVFDGASDCPRILGIDQQAATG